MTTEYHNLTNEQLIERLTIYKSYVDSHLVEEIVGRENIVPFLFEILKNDEQWTPKSLGCGYTPIHVIFILGLIRSNEAFDAMEYVLKHRNDDMGDWVTEDFPRVLFSFGKNFFERIKNISFDKSLDMWNRIAAIRALCALSVVYDDVVEKTTEVCEKIIREENEYFVSLVMPGMAEVKNRQLFDKVKKFYTESSKAKEITDLNDLERLYMGISSMPEYSRFLESLWNHFSIEALDRDDDECLCDDCKQKSQQSESKNVKIGRNDPCPCGSGKKYKKCCLK